MSIRRKAALALLLVSILWGSAGVTAKVLVSVLSPSVVLTYRFGLAALILLPWFLSSEKPKHMWRVLLPLSILSSGNALFFYQGITKTTASSASVINATTPLVTLVLSHLLIHEKTSKDKLAGILVGLIGAIVVIVLPLWQEGKAIGGDLWGNVWIILSVLSWTSYLVVSRALLSRHNYPPVVMTFVNFLTLAAINALIALVGHHEFVTPQALTPGYIALLLYATGPLTVVTFGLFQWVVKHISATSASLKDYLQLIISIGLSILLLGETINVPFIIGGAIVLVGLVITTRKTVSSAVKRLFLPGSVA